MSELKEEIDLFQIKIQGIKVNYAVICERKLWFFSKGLQMERESDRVSLGRVIHDWFYRDEEDRKEIPIGPIKIDILGELVKEVKLSDRMQEADRIQILYYLWFLKKLGVKKKGVIKYPKKRKVEFIELKKEDEAKVEEIIDVVKSVEKMGTPPPPVKKSYCTKCTYYELCWS